MAGGKGKADNLHQKSASRSSRAGLQVIIIIIFLKNINNKFYI